MAEKQPVVIPKNLYIKGEVRCSHDLVIEGQVDGNVNLDQSSLLVGPDAEIRADVHAKSVTVLGKIRGNVVASENVGIEKKGEVHGNIFSPKIAINEGASFQGKMNMGQANGPSIEAPLPQPQKPASSPKPPMHH